MIKHVSFDVWGTLISANPEYALLRTMHLAHVFGLDLAFVKSTYTRTKKFIDSMAETTGGALTTRECFDLLYKNLGVDGSRCALSVESHLHELFLEHAPTVLDEAKYQIAHLRATGITLSIGSNSNFIPGDVMYPFLQKEFDGAFKFGVFSDQFKVAKPDLKFFHKVIDGANYEHRAGCHPNSILHVGDNYICDGVGPRNAQMEYVILNGVADIQPAFRHLSTLFVGK